MLNTGVGMEIATALKTDYAVFQEGCKAIFDCRRIRCFHMLGVVMEAEKLAVLFLQLNNEQSVTVFMRAALN